MLVRPTPSSNVVDTVGTASTATATEQFSSPFSTGETTNTRTRTHAAGNGNVAAVDGGRHSQDPEDAAATATTTTTATTATTVATATTATAAAATATATASSEALPEAGLVSSASDATSPLEGMRIVVSGVGRPLAVATAIVGLGGVVEDVWVAVGPAASDLLVCDAPCDNFDTVDSLGGTIVSSDWVWACQELKSRLPVAPFVFDPSYAAPSPQSPSPNRSDRGGSSPPAEHTSTATTATENAAESQAESDLHNFFEGRERRCSWA